MGTHFIGRVEIDFELKDREKFINLFDELDNFDYYDLDWGESNVTFMIDGNNGLDFESLEKLCKKAKDKGINLEVSCGAYAHTGESFYYNGEEND